MAGVPASGEECDLTGLPYYLTGPADADVAIIVATDIYGWDGGQVRPLCDSLGAHVGATVFLPDFYRGQPCTPSIKQSGFGPWVSQFSAEKVMADVELVVTQLVKGRKCAMVGFCW